ncbi:hypothetical protein DAQ1742_02920 [Dickeya aquatica]|uniref:Uncharacterized protein n=1 Tax=Dickeya aquatica TaxID=1401087 RepID=A0A375ADV7_9GAMM|nr:hypothetical protein DAQ1742_02920 [Dickeya aquatica]
MPEQHEKSIIAVKSDKSAYDGEAARLNGIRLPISGGRISSGWRAGHPPV